MGRYSYLFSFLLLSALCFFSPASAAQLNQTQAQVLRNLSSILESGLSVSSARLSNDTSSNPCNWSGVTCVSGSSSEVVSKLSFFNLGISPVKSSSLTVFFDLLCSIDTLHYLDLSKNLLSSLPDSLFSNCTGLSGLKHLNLSYNAIDQAFPDFSQFKDLEVLDFSYNMLTGAIGKQLDSVIQLKSLNVSFNRLSGLIPPLFSVQLNGMLEELVLSANNFSGTIPEGIYNHQNLTTLDLSENQLTGNMPDAFSNLIKLETLLLNANNLSGNIPISLANLQTLSRFAAYQNNFGGSIPINLTKYMKILDLSYNNLTGDLHPDLLSASSLESVDLTSNGLTGSIPVKLSRNLYRLRLGQNQLTGTLPTSIGELSQLSYLELDQNNFTGDIPKKLGNCRNLTLLNLAFNNFENELPPDLGNLSNLVVMKLQMNKINGRIPDQISNWTELSTLNLSHNALSGEIPFQIFSLAKLSNLDLQVNNLSGSINVAISSMTSLIDLQLGRNKLNGTIPEMPSTLTTALNLSHNCFSGSIPSSSFLNSPELEILDLSYNNFSGPVPDSLTTMQSLTLLGLSNNNLSGTLPTFHSWVNVMTSGNALLLNPPWEPNSNSSSNSKVATELDAGFLVVTIVSFVSGMIASFSLAFLIMKCLKKLESIYGEHNTPDEQTTHSVETPSLDRYLAMVQRWQYVSRMERHKPQRRHLTPVERYRAIALYD